MHFYYIFELAESYTTRFHQKTCKKRLKRAKNRSKCPNYFPILAKGANFFPLPPRKRELCTPVPQLSGGATNMISHQFKV